MPKLTIRMLRCLAAVWAVVPGLALAQPEADPAGPGPEPTSAPSAAQAAPATEAPIVGQASATLDLADGRRLRYTATAETLPVRNRAGKTTAEVFVVAYRADGAAPAERPVTFLFNGGPGAASAFLMLGAAGPRVLVTNADGTVTRPPARLADNPASWLAFTDLVFVDPVGTGFSRAAASGSTSQSNPNEPFWGVRGDVNALSEIVRLWLTRNDRWESPKFLAGESYGGFRAVMMARTLQRDEGVEISGLVLVSPALEFSLIEGGDHELMSWVTRLPSMAAAAQAQGKAPPVDPAAVERFALTDYLIGLAAVDRSPDASEAADRRMAELTGLPLPLVERHDGRVPPSVFAKELRREDGRVVSRYDGSVVSPDPDPDEPGSGADPMLDGVIAPYATAFNAYIRGELGYESELPYRLLNRDVSRNWAWEDGPGGSRSEAGAMDALESVMALNPSMRVLVAHGVHDLVTPYFASAWLLDRMELPADVKANAELRVYEGGHMMYMRPAERARLAGDVRSLYESALAGS